MIARQKRNFCLLQLPNIPAAMAKHAQAAGCTHGTLHLSDVSKEQTDVIRMIWLLVVKSIMVFRDRSSGFFRSWIS